LVYLVIYLHSYWLFLTKTECNMPGTSVYNPSYSGDRDQEDRSSKPAQANSSQDPVLKNSITHTHTHTQRLLEWQVEGEGGFTVYN
jgi:hypothetical protein